MKKFEQFIQEYNYMNTITILRIYSEQIVNEWYSNIENYEDLDYAIDRLMIPDLKNLTDVSKNKKGRLVFRAILMLPAALDEAIETLEDVKKCCSIKHCFHYIDIDNSRATIRIEIAYDKIDENLLKSLSGINKFKL